MGLAVEETLTFFSVSISIIHLLSFESFFVSLFLSFSIRFVLSLPKFAFVSFFSFPSKICHCFLFSFPSDWCFLCQNLPWQQNPTGSFAFHTILSEPRCKVPLICNILSLSFFVFVFFLCLCMVSTKRTAVGSPYVVKRI